jgi:hypothetical protein
MNAIRGIKFRQDFRFQDFRFGAKTGVDYHRIFCSRSSWEVAMRVAVTWFAGRGRIFRIAVVASTVAGLYWADAALASQGPGTGPGTASGLTQLAMAVIVYGTSALVIAAGLVGAARGREGVPSASSQKYRKQPHAK